MNMKPRSLLAAVVALSLVVPGLASADRRGDGYRDHGDRHGYKHQKRERHYDRHDRGDRHYDRHDYRPGRHITNYYSHDDHDDDDLLIGLVVGGILGYAINGAQHSTAYDYSARHAPRASSSAYPADSYEYSDGGTCLQEREYQTTVVVGGRNVPAYGTACLQPDGSWKREPARLVSY